jgi:ferredoxin
MKITHLRHKCIGCNSCVEHAPKFWKMSKSDGKAILINSKKKGHFFVLESEKIFKKENEEAAKDCPVNIINVYSNTTE